jgi:hypothetical protein
MVGTSGKRNRINVYEAEKGPGANAAVRGSSSNLDNLV